MIPDDQRRPAAPARRHACKLLAFGIFIMLASTSAQAQTATAPPLDVPFVPTEQRVVDRMLQLARVGSNDVVYDLGSGDGRIVITAAKKFGAKGIGIDLDPKRVEEAKANARKAQVESKVSFVAGDLFKADLSEATVVTLYLLPRVNLQLRPQLWRQLKTGTRVVSHAFDMGPEWPPEKTEQIAGTTIYFWTVTESNKKAAP